MPLYTCSRRGLKILFMHVPKCGGGSIEKFFRLNGFKQYFFSIEPELLSTLKCSPQHFHADIILRLLDMSKLNYSFALFRDPVDRMVSEYKWRIKHPLAAYGFDSWYKAVRIECINNQFLFDNHMRSQVDFLFPGLNVFRFEDSLQSALHQVACFLDLSLDFSLLENQKYQLRCEQIKGNKNLEDLYNSSKPGEEVLNLIRNDYHSDFRFYSDMLPAQATKIKSD